MSGDHGDRARGWGDVLDGLAHERDDRDHGHGVHDGDDGRERSELHGGGDVHGAHDARDARGRRRAVLVRKGEHDDVHDVHDHGRDVPRDGRGPCEPSVRDIYGHRVEIREELPWFHVSVLCGHLEGPMLWQLCQCFPNITAWLLLPLFQLATLGLSFLYLQTDAL